MDNGFDDIADRLAAIEEELRDLAYERLAAQARDPESEEAQTARALERRLNQARRAIERAVAALRGVGADTDVD